MLQDWIHDSKNIATKCKLSVRSTHGSSSKQALCLTRPQRENASVQHEEDSDACLFHVAWYPLQSDSIRIYSNSFRKHLCQAAPSTSCSERRVQIQKEVLQDGRKHCLSLLHAVPIKTVLSSAWGKGRSECACSTSVCRELQFQNH